MAQIECPSGIPTVLDLRPGLRPKAVEMGDACPFKELDFGVLADTLVGEASKTRVLERATVQ